MSGDVKIPVTVKLSAETLQELIRTIQEGLWLTTGEKAPKLTLDEIIEQCVRKFLQGYIEIEE